MKLLLDFGNTRMKAACRRNGMLEQLYSGPVSREQLERSLYGLDIEGGMYCTVRDIPDDMAQWLEAHRIVRLEYGIPVPLSIKYRSPQTLGMDRLAAAVGAWAASPGRNLLVIDAGTAITCDFVSADGAYVGGNIAPGVKLRLESLHEHTGRLPLVDAGSGDCPMFGYDTETAIRSGVVNGIRLEIEGIIRKTRESYSSVLVFLTGGDAYFFEMTGKCDIFADADLVMKGLDSILEFNENKTE